MSIWSHYGEALTLFHKLFTTLSGTLRSADPEWSFSAGSLVTGGKRVHLDELNGGDRFHKAHRCSLGRHGAVVGLRCFTVRENRKMIDKRLQRTNKVHFTSICYTGHDRHLDLCNKYAALTNFAFHPFFSVSIPPHWCNNPFPPTGIIKISSILI